MSDNILNTGTEYVRERMGADATLDEARAMIEMLYERGRDLVEMSDEEFFALIPDAIKRSRHTHCNDCGAELCDKCGECHAGCFLSAHECNPAMGPRGN